MTPKEIVERVRRSRSFAPGARAGSFEFSDIDHLLAIHAAVVELFDAERAWDRSTKDEAYAAMVRAEAAKSNLAALCGWEWK